LRQTISYTFWFTLTQTAKQKYGAATARVRTLEIKWNKKRNKAGKRYHPGIDGSFLYDLVNANDKLFFTGNAYLHEIEKAWHCLENNKHSS
jgi:hypothetical protein